MKKIVIIPHARRRMLQRNINLEEVIFVVKNPDVIVSGKSKRLLAVKNIGDRELTVVYKEEENHIKIITLYDNDED